MTVKGARGFVLLLGVATACERTDPSRDAAVEADTAVIADTTRDAAAAGTTSTVDSLRAALAELVRGGNGSSSWFSPQTADVVREIGFDSASRGATVDFYDLREVIPNASSSAGSEALLRELNAAVFSVGGVEWVQYGMDGDCELFGEWLQYGECMVFRRDATR